MGLAAIYLLVAFLMSVTIYTEISPRDYAREENTTPWIIFLRVAILCLFWPFVIAVMTLYYILETIDYIKDHVHNTGKE